MAIGMLTVHEPGALCHLCACCKSKCYMTKQHTGVLGALTTGLPIADSSQVPAGPGSSTRPGRLLWGSSLSSVAGDEEHTHRSA